MRYLRSFIKAICSEVSQRNLCRRNNGVRSRSRRAAIPTTDFVCRCPAASQRCPEPSRVRDDIGDGITDLIDTLTSVLPDDPTESLPNSNAAGNNDYTGNELDISERITANSAETFAEDSRFSLDRADSGEAESRDIAGNTSDSDSANELNPKFLSDGGRLLFSGATDASKEAGIAAYAVGDYETAIAHFEQSRLERRNDPETLIYLSNAEVGEAEAVYVAAVVPISSNPNSAQELLRGVAHLQLELNDSGTTLPMKVVVVDDANNSEQAEMVAEDIVADERILFVMGHGTSSTTLAAANTYQHAGLVMMAPISTSTKLSDLEKTDTTNYIFRTIPSDDTSGAALATHVSDTMGLDLVVVFSNSNSSYSQSLTEAFTSTFESAGGETETIDLAAGAPIDQLQNVDADAIALFPDADTYDRAIAIAKTNANALPLIAGDAMYSINSLNEAGDAVAGLVVPVPWHPEMDVVGVHEFATAAATLWGGEINWRTALRYDAMQVFSQALVSGADSREEIAAALGDPTFAVYGVTGPVSFLSSGDRDSSLLLVEVVETPDESTSRSGVGLDFLPIDD